MKSVMNTKYLHWIGFLLCLGINTFAFTAADAEETDTLCAEVKIEIRQELTLERQAFDAHMRINNGLSQVTLENVNISVIFTDEAQLTVEASSDPNSTTAKFFIRVDTMENIDNVDGTGTVNPSTAADIHWLIIPAPGASGMLEKGSLYFVGATLNYTIAGESHETKVTPDYIYVKPLPDLSLDYFIPNNVYGDDAFTTEIEPPVPFYLGVRVKNTGFGFARELKIDSAQPKIVENDQGLLIGFLINGCQVNDKPVENTLLAPLGDIAPNNTAIARWEMTCTLSGRFVEFTATVSHSDELGGELTSLIKQENIHTHLLVKDVMVDLPGRDPIRDFLALDEDIMRVYESDSADVAVTDVSASSGLQHESSQGAKSYYLLNTQPTAGFMYISLLDPNSGTKTISQVIRSDGKQIKLENAWLSKTRNETHQWLHRFNLFDVNSTPSYRIVFDDVSNLPRPPVLQFINNQTVLEGLQLSFLVEASDPNGTAPSLSADPLPFGAQLKNVQNNNNSVSAVFDWTPTPGQQGIYSIVFKASDGELDATQTVLITVQSQDDSDGDGMLDSWELAHFGTLDRDGTGDFDNDGISDLKEFLFGLDPKVVENAPDAPQIVSPGVGDEVTSRTPLIEIENGSETGNPPVTYSFELYTDQSFLTLVSSQTDIAQSQNHTTWQVPETLSDNQWYYIRVRAKNPTGASYWTYGAFFVNTINDPPSAFGNCYPADTWDVYQTSPTLQIINSKDPDEDILTYRIDIFLDFEMTQPVISSPQLAAGLDGITSWTVSNPLSDNTTYYWRAACCDEYGLTVNSQPTSFVVNTSNHTPTQPSILSPSNASEIDTQTVILVVENAGDADGDSLSYLFEIDQSQDFESSKCLFSDEIPQGVANTQWEVSNLDDNTLYYFRVKATDGASESQWSMGTFFVNTANDMPSTAVAVNPDTKAWARSLSPMLSVAPANDPDLDTLTYHFEVAQDADFTQNITSGTSTTTQWTVDVELSKNNLYFFRAWVVDEHGVSGPPTDAIDFFVTELTQNEAPEINLTEPSHAVMTNQNTYTISWNDEDTDSNALIALYYDTDAAGADGTLIVDQIDEDPDGDQDTYVWDISNIEGTFYIYAVIDDQTTTKTIYSPFQVNIDRTVPQIAAAPEGGSLYAGQTITLSSNEPSQIYYTLDGSDPLLDSNPSQTATLFTEPITINESFTLRAVAIDPCGNQSQLLTEDYTIQDIGQIRIFVGFADQGYEGVNVYAFNASGKYTGNSTVTDIDGNAFFDPGLFEPGSYSFRADYLKQQFWSDPTMLPDTKTVDIFIEQSLTNVTFTMANGTAEGVRVYLFNTENAYLGFYAVTDANGQVQFNLPVGGTYKFRADYMKNQYWSDSAQVVADQSDPIILNGGGGIFSVTLMENQNIPLPGVKVYLFSAQGSYLGQYQKSDENGLIHFQLPAGEYKLRANYMEYQFWLGPTQIQADVQSDFVIPHQDITISVNSNYQSTVNPIANIKLYLFTEEGKYLNQYSFSDESGRAAYHLPDRSFKIRADYLKKQYWSQPFTYQNAEITIPMAEAQITVTMADQPLPDVKVYLFDAAGGYLDTFDLTDTSGVVSFLLPADTYNFRADYQNNYFFSGLSTLTSDQQNPITISTGGGTFNFTLKQNTGEPLENVKCYVFNDQNQFLNKTGTTDSNGQTSFNLADGTIKIRVDYLNYQYWSNIYQLPDALEGFMTIDHSEVVIDLVEDFNGQLTPVPETTVYLFNPNDDYLNVKFTTDQTGRVIFNLPHNEFKVRADIFEGRYWSSVFNAQQASTQTITILMGEAAVRLTSNSQPVEGADIYVFNTEDKYFNQNAKTDINGQAIFRLPAGTYKFRADYQSSQFFSDPAEVTAHQTSSIEISTGGGSFAFTLLKDVNTPLPDVKCYLFNDQEKYLGLNAVTNSEGKATFDLSGGAYKIRIDYLKHQFWTDIYQVPDTLSEIFTLPHKDLLITVNAMFQEEARPLEGIKVYLFNTEQTYLGTYQATDANGQVTFNLPDLPFLVRADYMKKQFWSDPFQFQDEILNIPMADVHVIVEGAGELLQNVKVYAFNDTDKYLGLTEVTNDLGRVLFRLPPGDYKFRANYQNSQYWSAVTTLSVNQVYEITVDTGGGQFSLTVETDQSEPIADVKCYAFNDQGTYQGQSQITDEFGHAGFKFGDGQFKFRIDYMKYQFWSDIYTVPAFLSCDFVIPHTQSVITVNQTGTASNPIEGVKAYLFTPEETYVGQNQTTDINGRAFFLLPDQPYKVRIDYLKHQFWSETFQAQDIAVDIPHGQVEVTVLNSGEFLSNVKVYLFNNTDQYLDRFEITDVAGKLTFQLPESGFKFRADHDGEQVWSDLITVVPGETVTNQIDF